ncbi:MAG: S8 family serine peptidase [candidate division NC10 bacterium]|nr:S8 family serine peptidase [candidate division NC10 bacterium]
MKTLGLVLMVVSAVLAAGSLPATAQELTPEQVQRLFERRAIPPQAQVVPGEVIVKMKPARTLGPADLTRFGVEDGKRVTSGGEVIYRIPVKTLKTLSATQARDRTLAVLQQLRADPNVLYAQPNYILRIMRTPNDPRFPEQWHYRDNGTGTGQSPGGINLPRAWDASIGSNSIVVAVIDTGILPAHPDIVGSPNLIAGFDMISDPAISNDGGGRDNDPTDPGDAVAADECFPGDPAQPSSWHGTHVAGTIGVGRTDNSVGVAGANWTVRVQAVRVLGKCGGTIADINDGIRWAAGLAVPGVPTNPTPARVINMSLGTPPGNPCSASPSTQAAIDDAVGAGAAVVVAAGNDAVDASQVFPASCNNVITVAASDARGHLVTRYSNFGTTVEILAPGGDVQRNDSGNGNDGVLSMVHPSAGTYARYNGTSMATPHVAGVAALYLAQTPTLTPAQLTAELQRNALPRTPAQCPQPCGTGLLSAVRGVTPVAVSLVLDPDRTLQPGETTTARATVTQGGVPQAGKTVTFSTANPSVASVSPASAVTGSSGQAQATVRGASQGSTTVTAGADGASASKSVQVPDLSLIGMVVLAIGVVLIGLLRRPPRSAQE